MLGGTLALLFLWHATSAPAYREPSAQAQSTPALPASDDWSKPFPPHRMIGNVYYVGSRDLASYLVATPAGLILINSNLESSVPMIRESMEKLGFHMADIKILLISHAHFDHDAGSAQLKKLTGAQYMVMEGDVAVVESGGKNDFQYGDSPAFLYPPVKVDRVLRDGDQVKLGDMVLTSHLTPGHTRGCTTWTFQTEESGKSYDVVIVGSPNVNPGYKLVNNPRYPEIARDYERGFRVLKSLPAEVFLGAHGSYYGLVAKFDKLEAGSVNPYIDPEGYRSFVTEREQAFRLELERQTAAAKSASAH
jgi:metallo-beta-lactamase class B